MTAFCNLLLLLFCFQSVCPERFPGARVFVARNHAGRNYHGQIIAVELELKDYDAVSGTKLLQSKLSQWTDDVSAAASSADKKALALAMGYDRRSSRSLACRNESFALDPLSRAKYVPSPPAPVVSSGGARTDEAAAPGPSLFSLVAKISDPAFATAEQRYAVRQVISDYLNGDIPQAKVVFLIGQVIGFQTLDELIKGFPSSKSFSSAEAAAAAASQQNIEQHQQQEHLHYPLRGSSHVAMGASREESTGDALTTQHKFSLPSISFIMGEG